MKISISLIVCLLFCSCGKQEPIYIGAIGGLSGRYSELGVAGRNGVDLAITEANEAGGIHGRMLVVLSADDMNSPAKCSEGFQSLHNRGVKFIIGPYTSNMAQATLESIAGKDMLVISPTISTDSVTSQDDNFLRVMTSNKSKAHVTAQYIHKSNHNNIAVTYDVKNAAFSETLSQQFSQDILKLNPDASVHIIPVNKKNEPFSSVAEKVIASNATALFNITAGIDGAALCQQLAKKNSSILVVGAVWMRTKDLIEHGGRSVEGVKFVSQYDSPIKSKKYQTFIAKYKKIFGMQPSFSSFYSYEATTILLKVLNQTTDISAQAVKQVIIKKGIFDGLQEPILFDKYGDVSRKQSITKVENGEFVLDEE